jgi:hypothetical protein
MHIRDERVTKPFGKRRAPEVAAGQVPVRAVLDRGGAGQRVRPLTWALRVSGIAGLLAVAAAAQLARLSEPAETPTRIARDTGGAPRDPETTGAIASARAAEATRLDPCLLPAADRLRP